MWSLSSIIIKSTNWKPPYRKMLRWIKLRHFHMLIHNAQRWDLQVFCPLEIHYSHFSESTGQKTDKSNSKTLFYNSFYLWLFKRHLISDKSETRGWCSCISSELIPGNHSKSQSQIRGFPLSKNSGWPAIKLSLVNRWRSQSEILVTHSLLLETFCCKRQTLPFFLFTEAVRASTNCKVNDKYGELCLLCRVGSKTPINIFHQKLLRCSLKSIKFNHDFSLF